MRPSVSLSLVVLLSLQNGASLVGPTELARQVEVSGVKVVLIGDPGAATVAAQDLGKHKLQINVALEPEPEGRNIQVRVELPISGRDAWPAADVEVLDSVGHAVAAEHIGIEWHKLVITASAAQHSFLVHVVKPTLAAFRVFPDNERNTTDPATGANAAICKWYDGRQAALCIRFDDSHPTHLSTAIPALRDYGFRGTFMINPGGRDDRCPPRWRSAYQTHRDQWEAVARRGDQEFANHTLHHRGAANDGDTDSEIGDAARLIWELSPHESKLTGLNLGGGTKWTTTKPLRHYLDKYNHFEVTGSLGMDDVYGNRVAAFKTLLERSLQHGGLGWAKIHFHSVGIGCASSEENFRAVLDTAKEHETRLWIAGLSDAYKYLTERRGAKLTIENEGSRRVRLQLVCSTNTDLFDQPLTIKMMVPEDWGASHLVVSNAEGHLIDTQSVARQSNARSLRFHVPPIDSEFIVETATPR